MSFQEILTYWLIVRKRLWLIVLLMAATLGTIFVTAYMAPPLYQASVKFQVTAPPPEDVSLFKGGGYNPTEEVLVTREGFIDVVTSRAVASQVIDLLQLPMSTEELQSHISIEEVIQTQVQYRSRSEFPMLKLNVQNGDPDLAVELVNTVMQVALQQYGEVRTRPKAMSREFITSQLEATRQDLDKAHEALTAFLVRNKIGDLQQRISLQQNLINDLRKNQDLASAGGELQEVANYDQLILQREVELQNLLRLDSDYASLKSAVERGNSTYEFLLGKETEAKLKENETLTLGFIQLIGSASRPTNPLPRVQMSILAVGGVLSLVLGIIIAFMWHSLETHRAQAVRGQERDTIPPVPAS